MARYYMTGFVKVLADSQEEADRKFDEAGLDIDVEIAPDVFLTFEGPWDDVDDDPGPTCICPPDLLERGGFKGRCPVHGSGAQSTQT